MPEFWNRTPTQLPERGTPVSAAASSGKSSGLKATMWFSAIQKSPFQATMSPRSSRPASRSIERGGLFGERAISSSRIHCTRTG